VLSLCGRDREMLAATAALARRKGAQAFEALFDVRDPEALSAWLAASDRRAPLDLVIANAGICRGVGEDGLEAPWDAVDTLRVNAEGVMLTALFAARIMRGRGRGQIAVISSQAAKVPLTWTPAYAASKAAARSYALSLRDGMEACGVEVTAVCPGYLKSPMQETFSGGLFGAWSAARAAERIASDLRSNPREIRFPFLMSFLAWAFNFLPRPFQPRVLRAFSFKVSAPGDGAPAGEAGVEKDLPGKAETAEEAEAAGEEPESGPAAETRAAAAGRAASGPREGGSA
jgi:short-subunit dehydrogenase